MNDKLGHSAKYVVVGLASIVILLVDSALPIYYVCCGVCNSLLSIFIKTKIKQPRPVGANKQDYGMPSSHAQSICFFATVLLLKVGQWDSWHWIVKCLLVVGVIRYTYLACEWRIATHLHTINQTLVGAMLGILVGSFSVHREQNFQSNLSRLFNEDSEVTFPLWVKWMMVLLGVLILLLDSTRKSKLFS